MGLVPCLVCLRSQVRISWRWLNLKGYGWRFWMGGPGVRSRLCRLPGSQVSTGVWPQGLLDAYIAMILKVDADSTPLGQRPLCVLPFFVGCEPLSRLTHLRVGLRAGFHTLWEWRLFGRGLVFYLLRWTLRRFCLLLVTNGCMSWWLMLSSRLTRLIGPF